MTDAPTIEKSYKPTVQNARGLAHALKLSFTTHRLNSSFRKRLTLVMFVTWAVMTVIRSAGFTAIEPIVYWPLTVCVFSIFFHMWGFEYGAIAAAGQVDPTDDMRDEIVADRRSEGRESDDRNR